MALRNGNVQAITQDDAKLVGLLGNLPAAQKAEFEISPFSLTKEYQGVGIPKGEDRLTAAVNETLIKLEKTAKRLRFTIAGSGRKPNPLNRAAISKSRL